MNIVPIKTRPMLPPKDDLREVIRKYVVSFSEKNILAITSKVVAIDQGRCVLRSEHDERSLIEEESDYYLDGDTSRNRPMMLTIKDNTFIPKAGIDTSNANGYFILWPTEIQSYVDSLYFWIQQEYHLENFGVLIIDSGLLPLRWGTVGISIAHAGFCPLVDYRNSRDIFERKSLSIVTANAADSLASAANIVMGEGAETTPLAMISDVPFVSFEECEESLPDLVADPKEDLFTPLINSVDWKKKRI